jgi:hypothetical protein
MVTLFPIACGTMNRHRPAQLKNAVFLSGLMSFVAQRLAPQSQTYKTFVGKLPY